MIFFRNAASIVGPVSPEVEQQLRLEEELNQIRSQSQELKKGTDDMISVLDLSRSKHGDLLKKVNTINEQIEQLEHYITAYEDVKVSGGNIDTVRWGEYLTSINPELASVPKDLETLHEATQRQLTSLYSQREIPMDELLARHQELADKSYTLITELNGFQNELKRNIFRDSKGFFAGVATVSPELASNLLNDVNLSEEERRDLELTISKATTGELPTSFEVEVSILRDTLKDLQDTILQQEVFLKNATEAAEKLKNTAPEQSANEITELEKAMKSISAELSDLSTRFKDTKEKMMKLEKLYDKHLVQPLKNYIDTIAVAVSKSMPEGASKEVREKLLQIIKEGLTKEVQSDSPTSLSPEDVQKMLTYAEKKGKIQDKFLVPLVVDHYVVGELHKDIPELKEYKQQLPDYYADDSNVENSLYGWIFEIGNYFKGAYSLKEAIRQLYISNYRSSGEDILNSKLQQFMGGNTEGLSKPEISVFNSMKNYVGKQSKVQSLLEKINEDFNIDKYLKSVTFPTYEGFLTLKQLVEELTKKKVVAKELLKDVRELIKDVASISDPADPEVASVLDSISTIEPLIANELGSANTLDVKNLSGENILEYKDMIADWLDTLEDQLESLIKPLERHIKDLLIYIDKSDYKSLNTDLEALMYTYATESEASKGTKVIEQINAAADKISSILDSKAKGLSDDIKAFGINIEDNTLEDFILSLLHKNESARGPRGVKETVVPSGLVKKQELSKEKFMKYSVNELVGVNNSTGTYRIVAMENEQIVVVAEDELQSGLTIAAEVLSESDIYKPLASKPSLGDTIVDETYGECTVINASKDNSLDIMLKSGVKIFDYPLHKLASEDTTTGTSTAHQCFMDGGWSISECCAFSKQTEAGEYSCGYKEAVAKEKEAKKLAAAVDTINDKEEKKQMEILKIAKLVEASDFDKEADPMLSQKSKLDIAFVPFQVGAAVYNRTLSKKGSVSKIDDSNVIHVKWNDGNSSKHWGQELISVNATVSEK